MKIKWNEYNKATTLDYINNHYNMFRSDYPITNATDIKNVSELDNSVLGSFYENGDPHRRTGCLFDGKERTSRQAVFNCDTSPYFNCGLFVDHKLLFTSQSSGFSGNFTYCIFDNVCFAQDKFGGFTFNNCILINCTGLDRFTCNFSYCIIDKKYGNNSSSYANSVVGDPMFISKDVTNLWDKNNNPNGVGYCRMFKWRGYDHNSPIQSAGICGIADNHLIIPQSHTWQPSYACDESKKIVLFNNQDYVDLDGNRRNYFDKTITEITLDFTKNGLTKEDMAAVKDIYENSDNEITIYPDENDMTNYIVGRLSKSDLEYSKMINSYWDNGKIDDERFNGVRMVIRVTDDSHFTRSV